MWKNTTAFLRKSLIVNNKPAKRPVLGAKMRAPILDRLPGRLYKYKPFLGDERRYGGRPCSRLRGGVNALFKKRPLLNKVYKQGVFCYKYVAWFLSAYTVGFSGVSPCF
jgi:hypothetical protein